jgi:hypothetical protein
MLVGSWLLVEEAHVASAWIKDSVLRGTLPRLVPTPSLRAAVPSSLQLGLGAIRCSIKFVGRRPRSQACR